MAELSRKRGCRTTKRLKACDPPPGGGKWRLCDGEAEGL